MKTGIKVGSRERLRFCPKDVKKGRRFVMRTFGKVVLCKCHGWAPLEGR